MNNGISLAALAVAVVAIIIAGLGFSQQGAEEDTSGMDDTLTHVSQTANQAMATGSLWMSEHHLEEIAEALESDEVDWEEAEEESQELIAWLEGATWPGDIGSEADEFAEGLSAVVEEVENQDAAAAMKALMEAEETYKHLHHEVMEVVAGGHGEHDDDH